MSASYAFYHYRPERFWITILKAPLSVPLGALKYLGLFLVGLLFVSIVAYLDRKLDARRESA